MLGARGLHPKVLASTAELCSSRNHTSLTKRFPLGRTTTRSHNAVPLLQNRGVMATAPLELSSPSTDGDLLRLMASRDTDAGAALFTRHRAAMFAVAYRIGHDVALAEDATQDAMLQAWRDAARYDAAKGSVGAWLLLMARCRALDRVRARQVRQQRVATGVDANDTAIDQRPVDRAFEIDDQVQMVVRGVDVLPESEQRVLDLAYRAGLTHTEIAERLDLPLGTTKTQLRRALSTLRIVFDERPRRPFDWRQRRSVGLSAPKALHGLTVLIIDDEADTVRLTSLVMRRAGADILSFTCPRKALTHLSARDTWPDLALIDLEMPDLDGYEVSRRLRGIRPAGDRSLINVAFTASGGSTDRRRSREAGFDFHVAKPIVPGLLVRTIAEAVQRRAQR
jgi:RNA polymerase sigma-70 factor (ECF subfamily)